MCSWCWHNQQSDHPKFLQIFWFVSMKCLPDKLSLKWTIIDGTLICLHLHSSNVSIFLWKPNMRLDPNCFYIFKKRTHIQAQINTDSKFKETIWFSQCLFNLLRAFLENDQFSMSLCPFKNGSLYHFKKKSKWNKTNRRILDDI